MEGKELTASSKSIPLSRSPHFPVVPISIEKERKTEPESMGAYDFSSEGETENRLRKTY